MVKSQREIKIQMERNIKSRKKYHGSDGRSSFFRYPHDYMILHMLTIYSAAARL